MTAANSQTALHFIRGKGPGAYAKGGPGSVPLRRGLLDPPSADPDGPCHLASMDPWACKVWLWLLLKRNHTNALALGDRRDMVNGTGLPSWRISKALKWLHEETPGGPYIETVRAPARGRPPLYRVLRDECLRGLREEVVESE